MNGRQARRLRQEAFTRYEDGDRNPNSDTLKGLHRLIKRHWTRFRRLG